jgi:hypothetical protein
MKKQMISIGSFFLMASSVNVSYASSNVMDHNIMASSGNMMDHDMASMATATKSAATKEQEATIKLDVRKIQDKGNKKIVQIKLTEIKDNKPVTLQDLKEAHTQKVHLLIIDDALEDYSHIHPKVLKEPGLYKFEWSPKKQANYRIWADLFPVNLDEEEYVFANLISNNKEKAKINHTTILKNNIDGYSFTMHFDTKTLSKGKAAMGKIIVTDSNKNPVKNLEPIMGAFAHIVGFSDDMKTVIHLHPMGKEPSNITDRGGPKLEFHIEPEKAGFIKIFAQVKINGKELFVPFGVTVTKAKPSDSTTTQIDSQKTQDAEPVSHTGTTELLWNDHAYPITIDHIPSYNDSLLGDVGHA